MKKQLFLFAILILFITNSIAQKNNRTKPAPSLPKGITALNGERSRTIAFTENKGQVYDQKYKARKDVLFGAMAGNMAFHLKSGGVSYQLYRVDKWKEADSGKETFKGEIKKKEIDQLTIYRIDLNWIGNNNNFTVCKDEVLPAHDNYYLESCPNGALNVKSYAGVTINNLYNGINLHYYDLGGYLKYDYIVAPGADYKQIQKEVKGAEVSMNKDGSLNLNTPLGSVIEDIPVVYQNKKQLKAKWVINKNTISFEIENYNPNYELIIDPAARLWGTYYGASGSDDVYGCSNDTTGNVYLSGITASGSSTLIATTGAHQTVLAGVTHDAFLVKFNTNGIRLWSTYYGGSGLDDGFSCATDLAGNVYMSGTTDSNTGNVIATVGAHQPTYGGNSDGYLVKFDSSGVRQWGTYYGGTNSEHGAGCATDLNGNVYLSGRTSSSNGTVIATSGSHQSVNGGITSTSDAYLVKFNSSGVRQWGTYYGGSAGEEGISCTTDGNGNVYMVGICQTTTGTAIATAGAHQTVFGGSVHDSFLVKFNSNGVRQWGTYYGGAGYDIAYDCVTDNSGNVYLTGWTDLYSVSGIASVGAHQTTHGGIADAFLVKFGPNGVRKWGTYYGGVGNDRGTSCAVNTKGSVYIAGYTSTSGSNFIATPGSHQSVHGGGAAQDAFLVRLDSNGVRQWGTYYGGSGNDVGHGCVTDKSGNIFLAGSAQSNSGTSIATFGTHQSTNMGSYDGFLAKFYECINAAPVAAVNNTVCAGSTLNFTASFSGTAIPTFSWSGPNSFTSNIQNPSITNAGTLHVGIYTLSIINHSCPEIALTQVSTVYVTPTISVNSGAICTGNSFTITPVGAPSYTIQGGSSVVSPTVSTSYWVTSSNVAGCPPSNTVNCNVTVNANPTITAVSHNSSYICHGQTTTLTASGGNTYVWNNSATTAIIIISPTTTTSYTVTGTDSNGCSATSVVTQNVITCTGIGNSSAHSQQSFVIVYPNPCKEFFNVKDSNRSIIEVSIYNTLGQKLLCKKMNDDMETISMKDFESGLYYVKVGNNLIRLIKE